MRPEVELKKAEFSGLYKKMEKENDSFSKLKMMKNLRVSADNLLEKLEYAHLINPTEEATYQTERDEISELEVFSEEAKSNCTIYIHLENDWNQTISTVISTVFSECGFNIVKNKSEANYIAEVRLEDNVNGSEQLSIKPSINLNVGSKSLKTVFSHQMISEEKSVGYSLESAQKKIYPKLSSRLQKELEVKLEEILEK